VVIVWILVGLVVVLVVLGGLWFLGMRGKWPVVLDVQRKVNRRVVNPRQMRTAGTSGAYAGVVRHVGRRSGRPYETPIVPLRSEHGFVVLLPYGARSDWVRNVLAAGSASIVLEGSSYDVVDPVLVATQDAEREFSEKEWREIRMFANATCLQVRLAAGDDGAGDDGAGEAPGGAPSPEPTA
jgi:deazaflavin-dependent oxidoreductase (nitroreductase family)